MLHDGGCVIKAEDGKEYYVEILLHMFMKKWFGVSLPVLPTQ